MLISTKYSSRQMIVILLGANNENGDMVAGRIVDCFYKLYIGEKLSLDYGIAKLESCGLPNMTDENNN